MKIQKSFYWYLAAFAYAGVLVIWGGCGASMPSETVRGTAAGEWNGRLPTTPSPFASMAYGRDGSGIAATEREPAQLDAYLKPEYRGSMPAPKQARVVAAAPVMAAKVVAPAPVEEAPMVASAAPAVTHTPAAPSDAERYAQRDASSKQQQEFKAGDVLVISLGSILVIVLIVVLLVLLLD